MPRLGFERATPNSAAAIAALHAAAAEALVARHGPGAWSRSPSERGVLGVMKRGSEVWAAYQDSRLVGVFTLGKRKPWAIDLRYFSPEPRAPRYLTDMAVAPDLQRRGIGRRCLEQVIAIAEEQGADVIRLDAYDGAGARGAGGFYAACGFREVGRASYRGTPLVYFERLLTRS